MYIIELSYLRPAEEVEPFLPAHRDYLAGQCGQGNFLVAGGRPTGAMIVASGRLDTAALHAALALDPLRQRGLTAYHITAFDPQAWHPALSGLMRQAGG